jgi:hypothetical protein
MRFAAHRAAFVAAFSMVFCLPASAQWQGSIGAGARSATHTEYGPAGQQLVREDGWLPGASLGVGYRSGSLTWSGGVDCYRGDIDYRGRTQAGAGASSTTSTTLASAHLGAEYAFDSWAIQAAFEIDRWRRDILGTAAGAGLQERYRSLRLLLGAGTTWHPAGGAISAISAGAAFVLAAPERMHIGFSGLFDPVSLDTRRGRGLRLEAAIRPARVSSLELRGRADWLKVPRSAAAALNANGAFQGTVTQPEHVRQALTLELAYLF